jgi:hypothetical protein
MCQSLEGEDVDSLSPPTQARVKEYTNNSNVEEAVRDLKAANAIISSSDLSGETVDDEGYRYGANGGSVLAPSKASSFRGMNKPDEGEIYTRADGKKVKRVKRASSASGELLAKPRTLSGFLSKDDTTKSQSKLSGSRSVGGEGDIYIRADGKKGKFIAIILFGGFIANRRGLN